MTKRTRYFMAGAAAVLAVGLCTGLVAYYGGFPALSASRTGPWSSPALNGALRGVLAESRPLKDRELEADFGVIGRRTFLYSARPIDWRIQNVA